MVTIFTPVMGLIWASSVLILIGARAEIHPLVAANRYSPEQLHLIEFDDEADTLSLSRTVDAGNTHVWMSVKVRRLVLDVPYKGRIRRLDGHAYNDNTRGLM